MGVTTGHSECSSGDGSFVLTLVRARATTLPAFGADVLEPACTLLASASLFRIKETASLILLVLAALVLLILVALTSFATSFSTLSATAAPTTTTAATAASTALVPDAFGDFLLDEMVDLAFGEGGRNGVWNGRRSLHVVRHLDMHKLNRQLNSLA